MDALAARIRRGGSQLFYYERTKKRMETLTTKKVSIVLRSIYDEYGNT